MKPFLRGFLFVTCCLLLLSGCALHDIYEQIRITENIGTIKGRVELEGIPNGMVVVKRYSVIDGAYVYESYTRASAGGDYLFYVVPGTYYIAAFVDSNRDVEYQAGENGNYYASVSGKPAAISVEPGQTVEAGTLTISGKPPAASGIAKARVNLVPAKKNTGRIVNMDDAMFSSGNYSLGMWKPVQFLEQVGGGLFFLQGYEEERIPVLFIHGINGGPTDWSAVVDVLDEHYFQPWVLYYPSGLRLDMVSDYLVSAIADLHNDHDFRQLYVVAHSMGGLVARSFVKKYRERFPDDAGLIRLVMSINSPMNGMASAVRGVQNSPLVVPAWRDLAEDSDFLEDLRAWPWPDAIPYYLVFSYAGGGSDDGVVPLQSQIPLQLQSEAARMYGFNSSHAGILNDATFLELFSIILSGSQAMTLAH